MCRAVPVAQRGPDSMAPRRTRRTRAWLLIVLLLGLAAAYTFDTPTAWAHDPHDDISAIAVSPSFATDHTLFAGTYQVTVTLYTNVLMKSQDAGLTWQVVPNFPNFQSSAIAMSPNYANDGTVFVSTLGGGILESIDGGTTWSSVGATLGIDVTALALSPSFASDRTLIAESTTGLYKSVDGGATWSLLLADSSVTSIAFSPQFDTDGTIFVGTASQDLYLSTNGGATWANVGQSIGGVPITKVALSPSYGSDHTVVVSTMGAGVYVSTDGGSTWTNRSSGIQDPNVTAVVLSPNYAADATLFAATASGQQYRSTNGAHSWTKTGPITRELSTQTTVHSLELAISPNYSADGDVFLGMYEGFWVSHNAGASWQYSSTQPPYLFRSLSVSPSFATDHTMIGSNYGGSMLHSTDGGQSFTTQAAGLGICYPDQTALTDNPAGHGAPPVEFAGTFFGTYKYNGNAGLWQLRRMLGVKIYVRSIAASPNFTLDKTVFIGTDNVYGANPITVTYHGQVYSSKGLFFSTDGGASWAPTALNGFPVQAIGFSPNYGQDNTLFVGSLSGGLFK